VPSETAFFAPIWHLSVGAFRLPRTLVVAALAYGLLPPAGTASFAAGQSASPQTTAVPLSDNQLSKIVAYGLINKLNAPSSNDSAIPPKTEATRLAGTPVMKEKTSSEKSTPARDATRPSSAKRPTSPALSLRLSYRDLDRVIAGDPSVDLNLTASAQGPVTLTSTSGVIVSGEATVLRVDSVSGGPVRLISSDLSTVIIAAGQAVARGADGAQCSASVTTSGFFSFLTVNSEVLGLPASTGLPSGVLCACSALAITPIPH
jgi:hypothetical protein